jgi:tetratricopeptide (TPR) repeat protein
MLRAIALALLLLLTLHAPARAEIESDLVKRGLAAYGRLEYERALRLLGEAARSESLTREEKLAVWRTSGFCHVALDRPDEARQDFVRLLTIDPGQDLDARVSPRARAAFEQARGEVALRGAQAPSLHHLPELEDRFDPLAPREGETVRVSVCHPGGLARHAQLFHRLRGEAAYSRLEADVDDQGCVHLSIPASAVRPPALETYLVMLDASGTAIARAGNLATPHAVAVRSRPVPLHRRRWFWGVVGGVAGAVVLTAVVVGATLSAPATITVQPR